MFSISQSSRKRFVISLLARSSGGVLFIVTSPLKVAKKKENSPTPSRSVMINSQCMKHKQPSFNQDLGCGFSCSQPVLGLHLTYSIDYRNSIVTLEELGMNARYSFCKTSCDFKRISIKDPPPGCITQFKINVNFLSSLCFLIARYHEAPINGYGPGNTKSATEVI